LVGALNDQYTFFQNAISDYTLSSNTSKYYNTVKLYSPVLSRGGLWFGIFAPPLRYQPKYISKQIFNDQYYGWMAGDFPPNYFAAIDASDALSGTDTVPSANPYTFMLGTYRTNLMINNFRYYKILRHVGLGRN
jgi:hypothetical protein